MKMSSFEQWCESSIELAQKINEIFEREKFYDRHQLGEVIFGLSALTAVLASGSDIPTKTLNAAQIIMRHTLHDLLEQEKKNV